MNLLNLTKKFIVLSISFLLLNACTDDSESYTYGSWKTRSDFDGKVRSYAAAFTIGNKGYMYGGYTGREYLNDLWEYNIDGDYWMQCAGMPEEASTRTSAVGFAVGTKGYITTGYDKSTLKYLTDTWEYDPASNSWTKMDDYLGGGRECAISFSVGNRGYVGCGYDDAYLKDFYSFNPNAAAGSQWEIVNGFGGSKRTGGTAFVIDDVAYVGTGMYNSTYVYDFWKFDPTANPQWVRLRDIADESDDDYDDDYAGIVRAYAVSFVIDKKGYLVTGKAGSMKTDYWVYDPATDLWNSEDFTPFEGSSREGAISFSTGTRGFVATGLSGGTRFDDTWELKPYELEEE